MKYLDRLRVLVCDETMGRGEAAKPAKAPFAAFAGTTPSPIPEKTSEPRYWRFLVTPRDGSPAFEVRTLPLATLVEASELWAGADIEPLLEVEATEGVMEGQA